MKIKRLTIRNIASIEEGVIDFEKGLIDRESGKPASLFLITGDTGSGKSVILDCISMALYGTTPRVKSVNGIKNNIYRNNDGEEISVCDISQYTRIGISWKDECYSELSFTGNDSIDYIARYSLGRTSHRNYRKPEWTLNIGASEIIENRKEEIRERIQTAVGLSFEQFSRMAMLAQGQFATFLTGKKEERERILEQLTATDIFSRYGEAISNIYKNLKQDNETSKKIYEEFRKKILDETMRQDLIDEQLEKSVIAAKCQTDTEELRKLIRCSKEINRAVETISSLKEEATILKDYEKTPEYRRNKKVLELWDSTTNQRELLSDKLKTSDKLASDRKTLQVKKSELIFLSDDLSVRKDSLEIKSKLLEQQKLWIVSQEPQKILFSESSSVISEIKRYLSLGKEIDKKKNDNLKVKKEIVDLNKNILLLKKDTENKSNKCQECQDQINQKSKERDELDPTSLRKENEKLIKRESSLNDLHTRITAIEIEKQETEKAEIETTKIAKLLSELKAISDKAYEECLQSEKEKDIAESRYGTMHLSVKENFEILRKRLVEEHASNCPLCGQSLKTQLHEWSNEKYFSDILSPLEEEKNKCNSAYIEAKKNADEAKQNMNTTSGSLRAKEEELKKRKKNLSKNEKEIQSIIVSLGIGTADNLYATIIEEISSLKVRMDGISKKLDQTEKLQKEIDALLKNKQDLDINYRAADNALQDTLKALTQKEAEFKQTGERIIELKKEEIYLQEKISSALKNYAPEWQDNPLDVANQLKKDAQEYSDKTSSYLKEEPEHRIKLKTLDSIITTQDKVLNILASIDPLESDFEFGDAKSLNIGMLQEMWHNFHIEVEAINNRVSENNSKIIEINRALDDYYQSDGISEATLRQLLEASDEISHIRKLQEKHTNELQKNTTLLAEATKTKEENLKILEIEDESKLEDIEILRNELDTLNKKYSELTQRLGAIKEKLEADDKNCKESQKHKEALEQKKARLEKWEKMNRYFGGTRFRTLVQSHILRPLLHNANIYLRQITDHYTLTCSEENEQLSILVCDRYHNNEPRSVTVLSGGERFMVSLALSLALSAMNRPDMNVDILFIDEGFGTLDAKSLDMVMSTLRRLPEINGQSGRRVGVISHREELAEKIDCQIQLRSCGEGRSRIVIP